MFKNNWLLNNIIILLTLFNQPLTYAAATANTVNTDNIERTVIIGLFVAIVVALYVAIKLSNKKNNQSSKLTIESVAKAIVIFIPICVLGMIIVFHIAINS